jgi:hypothetical protein
VWSIFITKNRLMGRHINWCMLFVWWSSVWEISGVQINWGCWSSTGSPSHLLSAFPNSTTGVSCLRTLLSKFCCGFLSLSRSLRSYKLGVSCFFCFCWFFFFWFFFSFILRLPEYFQKIVS